MANRKKRTKEEWKALLTPEQFHICREKGTEPPFSGEYYACKKEGIYKCTCCDHPLFDSKNKFDSGTGWPSFDKPMSEDSVDSKADNSVMMTRTEIICKNCDAHLGHVFDDGPDTTGKRYCINSLSLKLEEDTD